MNENIPAPTTQAMASRGYERQAQAIRETEYMERQRRIAADREYAEAVRERFSPEVMVVLEYVARDRDKRKKPLVWNVAEVFYGFWRSARESRGLAAWQEWVPASEALPRTDSFPDKWRLVYDPRGDVPVPRLEDMPSAKPPTEQQDEMHTDAEKMAHSVPAQAEQSQSEPITATPAKPAAKPRRRPSRAKKQGQT